MTQYVISDLHLDHENIIEYCDRPFDSVEEMNQALINNWNSVVEKTDTVFYVGDFSWYDVENVISFYERLNGEMVVVRGNHDSFSADEVPFSVVDTCTMSHNGVQFYLQHHPMTVPDDVPWWLIHGHTHNNELTAHPLINADTNRINVSCELLNYTPISLDSVVSLIQNESYANTIDDTTVFESN